MHKKGSSNPSTTTCRVRLSAGSNNSTASPAASHTRQPSVTYSPPDTPNASVDYLPDYLLERSHAYRSAFRPSMQKFIYITFRVRRANYEQVLWQLMAGGVIQKDHAYDPLNLPLWTIGMRVKLLRHLSLGRVMAAMRARLSCKGPVVKFCLDGFFGMYEHSDIFNNPGGCPWMELSDFSTVSSLCLQDGDNVFLCTASESQVSKVVEFRRHLMHDMKTSSPAQGPLPKNLQVQVDGIKEMVVSSDVIGSITYDDNAVGDLI